MIEVKYYWTIIALLSVGTFAIRYSIIGVSKRVKITQRHKQIFTFIPAAILPALLAPMVFFHDGEIDWLLNKERFVVLLLATGVAYLLKNMLATVVSGLVILYVLTHLL